MILYALTSAGPQGMCWNPRGPADVNVSEKHVWFTINEFKNILSLSLENFGENASKSSFFLYLLWRRKARYLRMFWKCHIQGKD